MPRLLHLVCVNAGRAGSAPSAACIGLAYCRIHHLPQPMDAPWGLRIPTSLKDVGPK